MKDVLKRMKIRAEHKLYLAESAERHAQKEAENASRNRLECQMELEALQIALERL